VKLHHSPASPYVRKVMACAIARGIDGQITTVATNPHVSPADLLADFHSVRAESVALVSSLTDDDLTQRGNHPALGPDTVLADFIRIIFMHGKMHLRDLTRALNS